MRPIESKKSDPTNKANRIEFAPFDPTECTRLVGTTSDYDRQDYFQILCCGRDIVVTILKLKCQKQKVHGEFGSTESLVKFLISAL